MHCPGDRHLIPVRVRHVRVFGWERAVDLTRLGDRLLAADHLVGCRAPHHGQLVRELRAALGLTVIMVTHDLDTLFALSTRVAVLADRHVVALDTPAVVQNIDQPWIRECFQGPRGRMAYTQSRVLKAEVAA